MKKILLALILCITLTACNNGNKQAENSKTDMTITKQDMFKEEAIYSMIDNKEVRIISYQTKNLKQDIEYVLRYYQKGKLIDTYELADIHKDEHKGDVFLLLGAKSYHKNKKQYLQYTGSIGDDMISNVEDNNEEMQSAREINVKTKMPVLNKDDILETMTYFYNEGTTGLNSGENMLEYFAYNEKQDVSEDDDKDYSKYDHAIVLFAQVRE